MVVCHDKTVQKSYEKVLHSGDNAIMSVLNMLSLVMLAVQAWNRVGTGTCSGLFSLFYVILAYLLPLALGLFSIKKKKLCTLTSACVWQHWRVCHPSSWWWSCHSGCPGSHLSSSETRAAASPWPSCLLTGRWPEYLRSVTVSCKRALTLVEDREDLWLTQGMWKQSIISGNPKDAV